MLFRSPRKNTSLTICFTMISFPSLSSSAKVSARIYTFYIQFLIPSSVTPFAFNGLCHLASGYAFFKLTAPISKSPSTFRAELKFFLRPESTVPTLFESAFVSCLHLCQVFRQDFYIFSPCNLLPNLRCKRINRIAACTFYIVLSVPF